MRATEYVAAMIELIADHGDIEVERYTFDGSRASAVPPKIAYRKILIGRAHKPMFYEDHAASATLHARVKR